MIVEIKVFMDSSLSPPQAAGTPLANPNRLGKFTLDRDTTNQSYKQFYGEKFYGKIISWPVELMDPNAEVMEKPCKWKDF